ncbi:hypothetical protein Plhal304r1_c002g0007781 [Plasmopara halstedii]
MSFMHFDHLTMRTLHHEVLRVGNLTIFTDRSVMTQLDRQGN